VKLKTRLLKLIDATLGLLLCRVIGYWRHRSGAPEIAPTPAPASIERILVIRPGGMGDMLMLLPVLRQIKHLWPDCELAIICERRNLDVLALFDLDHTAYAYDAHPVQLWKALRSTRFDLCIDTEQFHNFSAVMGIASGAPVRVGYKLNPMRISLYTHLVSYDVDGYELDQFRRLLSAVDVDPGSGSLHGALLGNPDTTRAMPDPKLIAIALSSMNRYKQWPFENTFTLIHTLGQRGYTVVLLGGADHTLPEAELSQITSLPHVRNRIGTCTLAQTAEALTHASVFVGCDSGLMHLSAALARPIVALFGPSDPRKWHSPDKSSICLRLGLPCSPCSVFGYQKLCRDVPCMRSISAETVADAIGKLLPSSSSTNTPSS
jgi:ADP-heptose:LPS heptosyltransferase